MSKIKAKYIQELETNARKLHSKITKRVQSTKMEDRNKDWNLHIETLHMLGLIIALTEKIQYEFEQSTSDRESHTNAQS